ncbi:hypothetical protein BDW69DRAFT_188080 [Aspergillus filifer]
MFWHLLSTCGYFPNYRPLAAPTVALPPLSYAIARCNINDPHVQRCIADLLIHPQLDINLRTPIFGVHVLHFATAHHNPDLLTWLASFIPGGLAVAGKTALGHTSLHIAYLPLTAGQTDAGVDNVTTSIHCVRTLDWGWAPYDLHSPIFAQFKTPHELGLLWAKPMTEAQNKAQRVTIELLLRWGGCDVSAQDMDRNTALHYLAGTLGIDELTVRVVRELKGGEDVWKKAKNIWGLTPSDLWIGGGGR